MFINFGFWVWSIDELSVSSQFSDALDRDGKLGKLLIFINGPFEVKLLRIQSKNKKGLSLRKFCNEKY